MTFTPNAPESANENVAPTDDSGSATNAGNGSEPPNGYARVTNKVAGSQIQVPVDTYVERTLPHGTKLEYALWLVERGFHVFPLRPDKAGDEKQGKRPQITSWQAKATRDVETVTRWFTDGIGPLCNIGVAYWLSGHCVIDLDVHDPAKNGPETWARLCEEHEFPPPTLMIETWSGGLQLIFHDPDGVIRTGAGTLGPGIDTRGENGYGVGPGSTIKGKPYKIVVDVEPAPLPRWLAELYDSAPAYEPREPVEYDEDWAVEYAWQEMRTERGKWGIYPEPGAQDHLIYTRALRLNEIGTPIDKAEEMLSEWAAKGNWAGQTADGRTLRDILEHVYNGKHQSEFGTGLPPRWEHDGAAEFVDRIEKLPPDAKDLLDRMKSEFMDYEQSARDDEPSTLSGLALDDEPVTPRQYLINGYVPAGGALLLVGPGAHGKSLLTQQIMTALDLFLDPFNLARCLERGYSFNNYHQVYAVTDHAPTVEIGYIEYFDYEMGHKVMRRRGADLARKLPEGVKSRAGTRVTHLHQTRRRMLVASKDRNRVAQLTLQLFGAETLARLQAKAAAMRAAGKQMVLVFDGVTNAIRFTGDTKIDDDLIDQLAGLLNHWAEKLGATIIALMHPTLAAMKRLQDGGQDIGNSMEWMNKFRWVGYFENAVLRPIKWNDGPHGWRDIKIELEHHDGTFTLKKERAGNSPASVAAVLLLRETYGRKGLDKLLDQDTGDEERAQIEQEATHRLRSDGRWGHGNSAKGIGLDGVLSPILREFQQLCGVDRDVVKAFLEASEEAKDEGIMDYRGSAGPGSRSKLASGYCFPAGTAGLQRLRLADSIRHRDDLAAGHVAPPTMMHPPHASPHCYYEPAGHA